MRFLTAIAALVGVALCSGAHGATAVGRVAASNPIPILMYHVIGDPPNGAPFPELYVDEKTFQAQLRWLERRGFNAVTLQAAWNHWVAVPSSRRDRSCSLSTMATAPRSRGLIPPCGRALAGCRQPRRQEHGRRMGLSHADSDGSSPRTGRSTRTRSHTLI